MCIKNNAKQQNVMRSSWGTELFRTSCEILVIIFRLRFENLSKNKLYLEIE
jgi:hypothetical protein